MHLLFDGDYTHLIALWKWCSLCFSRIMARPRW